MLALSGASTLANAAPVTLLNPNFDAVTQTYKGGYPGTVTLASIAVTAAGYNASTFGDGVSLNGTGFTSNWSDTTAETGFLNASTYFGTPVGWLGVGATNAVGYQALGANYMALKPSASVVDFAGYTVDSSVVSQLTGATIQANTKYTLTYLLGSRNAAPPSAPGYLQGTSVKLTADTTSNTAPANGNWALQTFVYDTSKTANVGLVGQALTVGFTGGAGTSIVFDNVTLDATPISNSITILPPRMRGISTSDVHLKADLFALLAQTDANVIRLGFSVDSINPSPATTQNPLAPYATNLATLDAALPLARAAGIKIILCAAETYGWNRNVFLGSSADLATYRAHLTTFWTAMAQRYLNEPAIVAYDVLNEPVTDYFSQGAWYYNVMPAAVAAIRSVNSNIWLVIESEYQGQAGTFNEMPVLNDPYIIYSFHMYAPASYTGQGVGSYTGYRPTYPGTNSIWGPADPNSVYTYWDKESLRNAMSTEINFSQAHPDKRILVGEFGALRWASGADKWLSDCIELFEEYGWDWCNHSPSGWNGWNATYSTDINDPAYISLAPDGGDRGARWTALAKGWALNAPAPFTMDIRLGDLVNWTATNPNSTYQPQWSQNHLTWTDLGTAILGNSISSVFHALGSPFYQVVETTTALPSAQVILPATAAPGLEISWKTEIGSNYQAQSSSGLSNFVNIGPPIIGDGNRARLTDLRTTPVKFYQVKKSTSP